MFTGLIEQTSQVVSWTTATPEEPGRLTVKTQTKIEVTLGESIALNGVCLTVTNFDDDAISFDVGSETLSCTTFAKLQVGQILNLERSLRMGDRLGGHMVSGHVDACAEIISVTKNGDGWIYVLALPKKLAGNVIVKGSIAIDGISLTINSVEDLEDSCRLSVCIIPKTLEVTNLSERKAGDPVNIETDIIGKYALRSQTFELT